MPNRFPFLKSKIDPYGLVEQFGIAVTVDTENDGSVDPGRSWFGMTLARDAFRLTYTAGADTDTVEGHDVITNAYAAGRFRYTAYDWKLTLLRIDDTAGVGEVEGEVSIKGRCELCENVKDHNGAHRFRYVIVKGQDRSWRIREWILEKQEPNDNLLNFLAQDL